MIHDLFAWLLATFVIGPVQAELASKMEAVKAPAAIMQQVQDCVVNGTPALIARAVEDPFWGITTTISVVAGLTDAQGLLAGTSPQCASAIGAVKPLLDMPEA